MEDFKVAEFKEQNQRRISRMRLNLLAYNSHKPLLYHVKIEPYLT